MVDMRARLAGGPRPFDALAAQLFDPSEDPRQSLAALVAVGSGVVDESGTPVLSARYHLFTRATEGAYTCLSPAGPHVSLGRREICEKCTAAAFEFGACQRCGAVYLTGTINPADGKFFFEPRRHDDQPSWLLLGDSPAVVDEDDQTLDDTAKSMDANAALLCTGCGALYRGNSASCCPSARMWPVQDINRPGYALKGCLVCGARGSAVRRFESGQDAAAAVVSTALYQALPPEDEHVTKPGSGRKLLLFSDSRQRAAFFAPYLDASYATLQHRRLIWEGLRLAEDQGEVHVDDLVDGVTRAATKAGVFRARESQSTKTRQTALWVMQELVTTDDRQSLEGRGLLRISLAREADWQLRPELERLGLDDDETWDLLAELTRTLRQQGVLTMPENVAPDDEAFAPRIGPIYVRSDGSDTRRKVLSWLPTLGRNRRLDFLQRIISASESDVDAREMLAACWEAISEPEDGWLAVRMVPGLGVVRQVDHTWLNLQVGARAYRCSVCRRLAPVSVRGICPTLGCPGTLDGYVLPDAVVDDDHYRTVYRSMEPIPLVTSEHTAQWTGEEAARIQQAFLRGDVNALSCSTTFELGVDVGELQSVVLRNMPPNTANYIQRAGRAGRRTASAALVVTYAQRTSHDLSRYQNPIEMIAGKVRAPYVPLGNERIDRRHAHSVALAAFFRYGKYALDKQWKTAGQFFLPDDAGNDAPVTLVKSFLTPVSEEIMQSLSRVIPPSVQQEIGIPDSAWVDKLVELLGEVRLQLASEVDILEERRLQAFQARRSNVAGMYERISNTLRQRDLLGFLANRNVLPKYGFPVDTVDLMTSHTGNPIGDRLELSRDLTSAIYEYAPGSEIVAGGVLWTSGGIYRRPGRELTGRSFMICRHCDAFQQSDGELEPSCPACDQPYTDTRKRYVIPEFGFVASRTTRKPSMTPPGCSWNGKTYVLSLAAEPEEHIWRTRGGGTITARAGARGSLLALSEGPGRKGYLICYACGWGTTIGKPPKSHEDPLRGRECDVRLQPVYLAHRYETDLLELCLDPMIMPQQDMSTVHSLLAAILEGAADRLQISRDDIDGTLYPRPGERRALVIYDTVPAGAGNALRIARSLDVVLEGALDRVADCDCGEETSCYGCLRNYRNQWSHDLLRRDYAAKALRRMEAVGHVDQSEPTAAREAPHLPPLDADTILVDTLTGQTTAFVLSGGRVLLHGETYLDAQQAADAIDYNVDVLDFWSVDLPEGRRTLRDLQQARILR